MSDEQKSNMSTGWGMQIDPDSLTEAAATGDLRLFAAPLSQLPDRIRTLEPHFHYLRRRHHARNCQVDRYPEGHSVNRAPSWKRIAGNCVPLGSVATALVVATGCTPDHGSAGTATPGGYSVTAIPGAGGFEVTVNPETHTAYVTGKDNIELVDTITHRKTFVRTGGNSPTTTPNGRTLYVTDARRVVAIDPHLGAVTATITIPPASPGFDNHPDGIGLDSNLNIAIAPIGATQYAAVADVAAKRFLGLIDVGGQVISSYDRGVAVDQHNHRAYFTVSNSVSVVDLSAEPEPTHLYNIPIPMWDPNAIEYDPTTGSLIVCGIPSESDPYSSSLLIVDPQTPNGVTATIPIAHGADGVAVDPTTQTAYVMGQTGTLTMVDLARRKVTATMHLGSTPSAVNSATSIAIDPTTHTAYVTVDQDLDVIVHK
jgi:DNA-binding beta-propeller fold protein YncE